VDCREGDYGGGELRLRWPRGRYNGQRIVGFRVKVVVNVDRWRFAIWPSDFARAWRYGSGVGIGPVLVFVEAEYAE